MQVEVTAKANHARESGLVYIGDKYTTNDKHAAELKGLGLVDYAGPAKEKKEGTKVFVSDKKEKVEPLIAKKEIKAGNVPTAKSKK